MVCQVTFAEKLLTRALTDNDRYDAVSGRTNSCITDGEEYFID